jgi:integrase
MARPINRLSAMLVSKITAPGYYCDGAGLYLQVSPSGSKSWIFRYRIDGRQREMGLGPLIGLSLAEARTAAATYRKGFTKEVRIDHIEARQEARSAAAALRAEQRAIPTFDAAARLYIAAHRHEWKNDKHAGQWQATLDTYVSPVFGNLPVNQVDTPHVLKALADVWVEKTETATRVRGRIESVLDWARVAGYRTGENPARWRGHLEHSLAAPKKTKRVRHHPALPWAQIGAFLADLRQREGVAARAIELAVLAGVRSGEARLATWAEIDLQSNTWTIPGSRMKEGIEHRVPLSDAAIKLLRQMPRIAGCDWIFPGAKNQALSDMSLLAVIKRMHSAATPWIDPSDGRVITVHGFRSTLRTWLAEATSFPREVCEYVLAHSLPDKVEAAYSRGDLFDKRVMVMQAWADYCSTPSPTTATVTPIRGSLSSAA